MAYKVCTTFQEFQTQNQSINLPFLPDTAILGKPLTVGTKTIPNRLACQAMEGCDGTPSGSPDRLTIRRYDRFAKGGAGLIWFEATAALEEGRANPRQLWIQRKNLDDFKRQVEAIKETALKENGYAPVVIMQATHSGRYSKPWGAPAPLIACHNSILEEKQPVDDDRIVTDDHLMRIGQALVEAAELAEEAGFDGVDIKCCHRYLLSELLSAHTRPGPYGGDLPNRARLLLETVEGARQSTCSDFLVTTRLNAYDGFPHPWGFGVSPDGSTEFDPTEPIWLLQQLKNRGVELVNITMGNPYFNPHVNRPFATGGYEHPEDPMLGVARMLQGTAQLKAAVPELKFLCSATTFLGVAAPHVTAAMIENDNFDLAGFGRTIFANPDFARDILKTGTLPKEKLCICCSKCSQLMRAGGTPGCIIRDKEVYGPLFRETFGGK